MCFHYGSPDGQLLNPAFKLSSLSERKYNFLFYSKVENVMKPQIFFPNMRLKVDRAPQNPTLLLIFNLSFAVWEGVFVCLFEIKLLLSA